MRNAAELLSNMDERLAADLVTVMPRPAPSTLMRAIEPDRAAAIMAEMTIESAVAQLAELSEVDPGGASMLLFSMHRSFASQLLAELGPPHPAELFSRMVARALHVPESETEAALQRLATSGYVIENTSNRAGVEHYSLP